MAPTLLIRQESFEIPPELNAGDVGRTVGYFAQSDGLPYVSKLPFIESLMGWFGGSLLFMGFD
ncbi:hypothetical protein TWF132_001095 [Orbilia oligospora]|nr:hypothetical protein TWF132_001095 [Orbilia oligospora]